MAGRRLPIGIAIVAFCVAAAGVVSGQTTFGMIAGRVTDSTGAVLPGATVTVTNIRTGDKRVVVTNEQGLYRAPNLSPSSYEIRVELQGFRTVVRQGVAVSVSETLDIAFRLDLESVAETLTVKGESPLVSTQSPEIGQKVEAERVLDLPVNSRDFSRLALLAPGAKVNTSGVASLAFNGGDIAQNNFLLDGTDATHIDNSFMSNGRERGARLQTASSESVEEFRVLTSNYSAEYGRAAAAVVTAITKSGTNAFKGSGYFFYRDDSLNTRNFFETDKAPFSLKQFGASLGGPIQRDRLFFFTNYEGSRKHLGATQTGTVPSEQFRATVAPVLSKILSTIPLPSQPTSNPNVGIATISGVTDITENIYSLRMDFRASDKDMVFGRFNIQDSLVDGPLFVLTSSMFAGQRQHAPIVSGSGTVSYTRTLRSNLMNEAKVGINRVHLILNQLDPNFPNPATLKTPDAESYPQTRITGVDVVAGQIQDIDRMNFGYELIDNVTWYSGRHTVKTGVNARRKETHPFQAGFPTMNYASLADFAANKVQTATAAGDGGPGVVYGWEYSGYVQDNIKATDRLTLNLGLRYDYGTPFNAAEGTTLANFDLKTLTLVTDAPFYQSDRNNFAPRVSATYDLQGNGRTVVGGGYGVYYNPYALQSFFGGTLFSNVQPSATFNQTTNPGLSYPLPPITGGVVPPPNRTAINPDRVDNYAHQFTANVQQEIGANMSVQIGYVGTRTENDMNPKPGNLIDPALGRRPLPQFGQFTINTETGHSTYNAIQFLLNRRLSKGVAFNTTYTYSRYRDNKYSQSVTGPEVPCANDRDFATCAGIENEWGPADLDTPHNFNFNAIWRLPLGTGRWREGWQLNGILLARSGLPYSVFLGTSRAGTGWFTNQRPNVVPGVNHEGNIDGPTGWLNPAAFTDVPAGQYGNLGRNTERGPHFIQLDMSLFKNIPLQGSHRIQLRVEVFNVPNNPIWAASPSSTWLTQSSFGRILNTFGRTESFGTSRQIQLAVRYDF
jgi:Carboxypeptidase regulatory-like domain/TonB dependent receptor